MNIIPRRLSFSEFRVEPISLASLHLSRESVDYAAARCSFFYEMAPDYLIRVLKHSSLSASKLREILINENLPEEQRIKILYDFDNLADKVPTLSGDWETNPGNLTHITDGSHISSSSEGSVYASETEKIGYITIDIGSEIYLKCIAAKWTGSQEYSGAGFFSAEISLQTSVDGSSWVDRVTRTEVSGLDYNDILVIDDDIRYVRLKVRAEQSGGSGWSRTKLSACYFIMG